MIQEPPPGNNCNLFGGLESLHRNKFKKTPCDKQHLLRVLRTYSRGSLIWPPYKEIQQSKTI